jgi:hypothetical protein
MSELVENSVVKESLTTAADGKRDLLALSGDYKRRADIPVRHAGWKTRPQVRAKQIRGWETRVPLKGLTFVARRAKGEILEGCGV